MVFEQMLPLIKQMFAGKIETFEIVALSHAESC